MKPFVLILSAVVVLVLATTAVQAQSPYWNNPRGYGPAYGGYGPGHGVYAPNYGVQVNNYGGWGAPYYSGNDAHSEAVRRIMANHSRYRYYTHPRSQYNSPPTQADYFGWEY